MDTEKFFEMGDKICKGFVSLVGVAAIITYIIC